MDVLIGVYRLFANQRSCGMFRQPHALGVLSVSVCELIPKKYGPPPAKRRCQHPGHQSASTYQAFRACLESFGRRSTNSSIESRFAPETMAEQSIEPIPSGLMGCQSPLWDRGRECQLLAASRGLLVRATPGRYMDCLCPR